jgi:2'-5' RNA ligase
LGNWVTGDECLRNGLLIKDNYVRIIFVTPPALIRAFIAVELPEQTRQSLRTLTRELQAADRRAAGAVRWVSPENVHLTLKFLGNVPSGRIPELAEGLKRVAGRVPAFSLIPGVIGCFPNTRRPNNIWLDLRGDTARALELAEAIEVECAALGLPRENHLFAPHLTLGRVKRAASPGARAAVGELARNYPPPRLDAVRVASIALIKSNLGPSAPTYEVLERAALAGQ